MKKALATEQSEAPRMDNSARDIQTDLIILGAMHRCLIIMKANEGYSAVVVKPEEYIDIIQREHFNGPTISEACRLARAAAQDGRA